jgi:hypothetical protein
MGVERKMQSLISPPQLASRSLSSAHPSAMFGHTFEIAARRLTGPVTEWIVKGISRRESSGTSPIAFPYPSGWYGPFRSHGVHMLPPYLMHGLPDDRDPRRRR